MQRSQGSAVSAQVGTKNAHGAQKEEGNSCQPL